MAYPRKFREKIALQMQKQAEETAAFEAILREVSASTRPAASSTLAIKPVHSSQLVRSLPNVNQLADQTIDLQHALVGLEEYKRETGNCHEVGRQDRGGKIQKRPLSRDRLRASLPYDSVSYLSPSADNNWRRASSDSSLHLTVASTQPSMHFINPSNSAYVSTTHFLGSGDRHSSSMTDVVTQPFQLTSLSRSNGLESAHCGVDSWQSLPDLCNQSAPVSSASPDPTKSSSVYDRNNAAPRHTHRPEPFVLSQPATSSQLLTGGRTVVNGVQPEDQCLQQRNSPRGAFSPMSPQPIITLTDASVSNESEEILYSEDLDAIQEYLLSTSSPMVTLSPSFFRQLSGFSTPPTQPAALPSKLALESSSSGPLRELRPAYQENSAESGVSSSAAEVANSVRGDAQVHATSSSEQQQQTLLQWNESPQQQHQLRQLQLQNLAGLQRHATTCTQSAQQLVQRNPSDAISDQQSGLPSGSQQTTRVVQMSSEPQFFVESDGFETIRVQQPAPPYCAVITSLACNVDMPGVVSSSSSDVGLISSIEDLLVTSSLSDVISDLNDTFDFDLMSSDDPLTLGLDPLDFDELQMLTDCAIYSDPNIEKSFRRDRNFNSYQLQ